MSEGSGSVSDAVAKIEQELSRFWSQPDTSSGKEVAKVRASTMNYAVVTTTGELPRLRDELDQLAETRAGRLFLFTLDGRRAPWEITSEVAAACRKDGDDVVCHDRVEVGFGAMAAGRAASVLSALALGEVPIIVEAGKGAPASLALPLAQVADRLVVDSSVNDVVRIAEALEKSRASVADRALVRGYSIRDLVARCFDGAPTSARAIERVKITRTPGGAQDPAALLLGWLASRLGWSFVSKSAAKDGERSVAIELAEAPRAGLPAGEIVSIEMVTRVEGGEVTATVARDEDVHTATWSLSGARAESHRHALGFRDEAWVLSKALDPSAFDGPAREAILAAAAWSKK